MPHWFRKQYDGLHLGTQHIHNLDSTGSPQEIRVGLQVGNRPQQIVESVFVALRSGTTGGQAELQPSATRHSACASQPSVMAAQYLEMSDAGATGMVPRLPMNPSSSSTPRTQSSTF